MYDMQITLYDANLSFFMDKFIIYVIIQHTKSYMLHFIYLILFIDVSIEKKKLETYSYYT